MKYEPGNTVGHWTLMRYLKSSDPGLTSSGTRKAPRWVCKCVCGMVKEVSVSNLSLGRSRSCGCQQQAFGFGWKKIGLGMVPHRTVI